MDTKQLFNLYRTSKHYEYVVGQICRFYLEFRKERANKALGNKDTDELFDATQIKKCFGVLQGIRFAYPMWDYWMEVEAECEAIPEALDYEDGDSIDNIHNALWEVENEISDYFRYLKKGE